MPPDIYPLFDIYPPSSYQHLLYCIICIPPYHHFGAVHGSRCGMHSGDPGSPTCALAGTRVAYHTFTEGTEKTTTALSKLTASVIARAGPAGSARSPVAALAALGRAPLVAARKGAGRAARAGDGADHEAGRAVVALRLAVGRGGSRDGAESKSHEGEDGDHGNERRIVRGTRNERKEGERGGTRVPSFAYEEGVGVRKLKRGQEAEEQGWQRALADN